MPTLSRTILLRAASASAAVGVVVLAGVSCVANVSGAQTPAASEYATTVQPIFKANCVRCHNDAAGRAGLSLESPARILKGGKDGTVVVPGHPEQSLLIKLIRHEGPADDPMPMPPRGKLSDADIAAVTKWIKDGAIMP